VEALITEVSRHADLEELSRVVADVISVEIDAAVSLRGRFSIALSGGRTPRLLFEYLASHYCDRVDWDNVHLFWGDERYVPEDHPDSNYAMAVSALISRVPIPQQNVHRMPTGSDSPENEADSYERLLRNFFSEGAEKSSDFSFDLILQGLGEDGHTASLFPGDPVLLERERWVVPVKAPPDYSPQERITLTYPVLNRSRKAFFVVSGEGKRVVLNAILENPSEAGMNYPAAGIRPMEQLVWYVDDAASGVSLD
jgi:6-phosphogluconolactonase